MDYDKQEFEHLFKDADDAKDVVHQVFTQMWRGKPKIADESVRGYLLAATRNQCLHLLCSRQLERQMVHDLRQDMDVSESEERKELLQQLQQVIEDNLTEQDRRVLSLHYEEDMTYNETAKVLGISSSAVNKHITRSLAKIRKALMQSKDENRRY